MVQCSLDTLLLLFCSLCHFTDCRPTAGSSVDVEGQVNKSSASYAKLIKQRSNCATLPHPHIDRYKQGVFTHTYLQHKHIHALVLACNEPYGYTWNTQVCHWCDCMFYLCLLSANMIQSLSTQPAAWQLLDLIFQRLRIDFYRLFPYAKANTNTF